MSAQDVHRLAERIDALRDQIGDPRSRELAVWLESARRRLRADAVVT
jgi:hypothetical protein